MVEAIVCSDRKGDADEDGEGREDDICGKRCDDGRRRQRKSRLGLNEADADISRQNDGKNDGQKNVVDRKSERSAAQRRFVHLSVNFDRSSASVDRSGDDDEACQC